MTSEETKHAHIRKCFVKEYQEEGKIMIKILKSEENDADINTQNSAKVTFQKHQKKIV